MRDVPGTEKYQALLIFHKEWHRDVVGTYVVVECDLGMLSGHDTVGDESAMPGITVREYTGSGLIFAEDLVRISETHDGRLKQITKGTRIHSLVGKGE